MILGKHACDLDFGSDSMLPKANSRFGRGIRAIRKLGQLSECHPETFEYFRSYTAVIAERQRQLLEDGTRVIHPLSLFNIIWKSVMIVVNLVHMCLTPFRMFFVLQPARKLTIHPLDLVLLGINAVCAIDIFIKFNTGYIDNKHNHIVMRRKTIIFHYLRRWFILDLVSCLPIALIVIHFKAETRVIVGAHLLSILRATRICTVTTDLRTFLRLFSESYIVHGLVRLAVIFLVSAHWCSCLMYCPAVISYYWTPRIPVDYNYYMHIHLRRKLLVYSIETRYNKAIIIALSAFFGTGFTMFRSSEPDEILIHSIIIMYAAIFMVFTLVFLIKSYLIVYGSTMHYQGLMNQVEEFMKYRQFPLALKKRVRAFYQYKYQERYYKEESDLDCLSEELRDEIKLHTCHALVHKVKLFENIPASVVGMVLGCLHPEVYLSNDLVVRAGDIGDCMYFIGTGTVAVYSLKGLEVCHLTDGAHFGAVALLMKDSKRIATVVAVEITQLYRLDIQDFNRFVMSNPTLYSRIETLASYRMHETVLLDDEFRRDRELLVEHQPEVVE